ncbi:MAG: DUF5685 family protein [Anaerocolumna sp.]
MFGYVTINKPELKVKDFDKYQSFYCGLCRILKQKHGIMGQMTLTYDMTFLIILLSGLYEPVEEYEMHRCNYKPIKKIRMTVNEITEYGAHMNILLAYYNLVDDWEDDRNLVKGTGALLLHKQFHKVKDLYKRQGKVIKESLEKLRQYEQSNETDIDLVAGLMGDMLGEIFVYKQDEWEPSLRRLGFYLGKFIYLMDAFEDRNKDKEKGRYNLFVNREVDLKDEDIVAILNMMMAECAREFERLPIITHIDLLRNILYAGVWKKYEFLQAEKKNQENS